MDNEKVIRERIIKRQNILMRQKILIKKIRERIMSRN